MKYSLNPCNNLKKLLSIPVSSNNTHNKTVCIFIYAIIFIPISFFIYNDFILSNKLFLFKDIGSDTINITLPHLIHLSDYLRTEGLPGWSFNQGMGQNIFPFSLGEPFNLILMLLGKKYLPFGIIYVEILKMFIGGLFFLLFLNELKIRNRPSILGGLMFSFSGYVVLGGSWNVFSTEAVYCALLLYSLERYISRNKYLLLPIPILLISFYQPFNLFMYGLLILVYSSIRFSFFYDYPYRMIIKKICIICGICMIGVGMSSVLLFSNIYEYLQSPRVSGDSSLAGALLSKDIFQIISIDELFTSISRIFSSDLLGTGSNFRGTKNYLEAPILYCGLLNLLLFPQVFYLAKKRQCIAILTLIGIASIMFLFPFLRSSFWLFTGDYYRTFSFFILLLVLFSGVYSLNLIIVNNKLSLILHSVTFFVLLSILSFLLHSKIIEVDKKLLFIIIVFLTLYFLVICLFKSNNPTPLRYFLLLMITAFELASFSHITINNRMILTKSEYYSRTGYNDFSVDAVSYIKSIDDTFFRINKDYSSGPAEHASINDAKVQDYYGTSSYSSFNQKYYIKFLSALNVIDGSIESQTRWAPGLDRVFLNTFGSVKYYLVKNQESLKALFGYSKIAKFGDVYICRNDFYLPLGIAYTKYMFEKDFMKLSIMQKDTSLLNAVIINEPQKNSFPALNEFDIKNIPSEISPEYYRSIVENLRSDALVIKEKQTQNNIIGTINAKEPLLLLFTIPFDKGWVIKIDGKKEEIFLVDFGMMGIKVEKGLHSIELNYSPPLLFWGSIITILSFIIYIVLLKKRKMNTGISQTNSEIMNL
jgi:uncharacterized membrane protein YfhO